MVVARPRSEDRITVRSKAWRWSAEAVRVIDLHDGTFLARMDASDEERRLVWVRMAANAVSTETISGLDEVTGLTRPPRQVQASREDGAMLPVVGASLAAILERALDSRGNKDLPVQGGSAATKKIKTTNGSQAPVVSQCCLRNSLCERKEYTRTAAF